MWDRGFIKMSAEENNLSSKLAAPYPMPLRSPSPRESAPSRAAKTGGTVSGTEAPAPDSPALAGPPAPVAKNATPSDGSNVSEERRAYEAAKRFCDIAAASCILLVLAPAFLVIAACIVLTGKGPVLFKQVRLGRNGKTFFCFKFRSMVADAEAVLRRSPELADAYLQQGFKLKNDPRVTRIGAFLRKTSLDELPQLVNVLRGEMSMIGPRPIVPKELAMYGEFADKLLTVKPGLSGMWQACGRSETSYPERVQLDMTYIDQRSLWLDLKLALLTVSSVLKGTGAH